VQQDKYKNPTNGSVVHHFGFVVDYRETIKIEGGATVTLKGQDNDCLMGRNCKPPANDPVIAICRRSTDSAKLKFHKEQRL
jgi:hypothetical protein